MDSIKAIIYGEVLFDQFIGRDAVLGGAPFNVAWHLHGFGAPALFISRVGSDALGDEVIARMQAWGMDCQGIQRDAQHPTGTVQVQLRDGQPDYTILEQVAYDFIDAKAVDGALCNASPALVYHGSLITRSAVARQSLLHLRAQAQAPVFVDINLRAPWHQRQQAEPLLQEIQWLKLNDEELQILTQMPCATVADAEHAARELLRQHPMHFLVVTLGHRGAFCLSGDTITHTQAPATEDLVDTVGAGDALSAVLILGILNNWNLPTSLERGVSFAAAICQQPGATQMNHDLYREFLHRWEP